LEPTQFRNLAFANPPELLARSACRVQGHLAVLCLGYRVLGVDPVAQRVLWERSLLGSNTIVTGAVVVPDPRDGTAQFQYPDGSVQKIGQLAAVTPSVVCVQTYDSFLGLDPVTGKVLWQRSDVDPGGAFFHDDEHVFLVRADLGSTQAFRLRDGGSVKVPDCSALHTARLGQVGRKLLVAETDRETALRLYDALTGKDVWKRTFPAGSRGVTCMDAELAAIVDPNGNVTVLDAAGGKELVTLSVEPKQLQGMREVRLLSDANQFYLAIDVPPAGDRVLGGTVTPNFPLGSGIRTVPISGWLDAFSRTTGKIAWRTEVAPQQLLVSQFRDLPVIICTSRYTRLTGGVANRGTASAVPTTVIDKRHGKLLYDDHQGKVSNQPFHALARDPKSGTIELVGASNRLRISPE
jgi:outer membrane protein assembly factor BamB